MTSFAKSLAATLLAGTAVTAHAAPNTILFSSGVQANGTALRPGQAPAGPITVRGGVTQVQTGDGEVFSFVGDATFDAGGPDLSISDGRVTVSGGRDGAASFNVGGTITTSVNGQNAAASFTVAGGSITGARVLAGSVSVAAGGVTRSFDVGQAFAAASAEPPRLIATPGVAPIRAAAFIPTITPPDQGVAGDVEPATSVNLGVVPGGAPLTTFEAVAALRGTLGGFQFSTTTPAFFDVNLASVRAGQPLGGFRSDTAAALTAAYLAALRAGTSPSAATANAAYQAALFSYFRADGLPSGTPAATRDLLNSYNAIIAAGGSPTNFSATAIAASLSALQRYLAAGGDRAAYTAATSALIAAYDRAYGTLGAGNAASADVASIEAARALQAALGSNVNLSVASAASLLSAYFGSLGTGNVQTGGLTTAQLQALLAYYSAAATGLTIDAAQAAAITNYQSFIAGGGAFGAPAATAIDIARNVARVVEVRRQGQAAAFADLRDAEGLTNALLFLVRNGVPDGLTTAERERVDAALAFFGSTGRPNAGPGGIFETPGVSTLATGSPLTATVSSALTTGNYVVAGFGRTDIGYLTGSSTGATTFANGLPTTALRLGTGPNTTDTTNPITLPANSVLIAGRAQDGWLIGRFAPSAQYTVGRDFAFAPVFTGVLPTSGTATYALTAWTTPQYGDQRLVTAASMTGNAVVNFAPGLIGITPNVTISATDPLNTYTYTIAGSTLTTNNTVLCPTATACRVSTPLLLGGTAGQTIVGAWSITNGVVQSGNLLGGAWVFTGSLPTTVPAPSVTRVEPVSGISSNFTTGTFVGAQMSLAGTGSWGPRQIDFNTSGQTRLAQGLYQISATGAAVQSARTDDWLMSRWRTSAFAHERDIVVIRPLGTGFVIPTTGRAEFLAVSNLDIVSATSTTYTATRLDGRIAIAFGSTPLFGIDAVLGLTQTSGAVDTYRFGSPTMFTTPNGTMIFAPATNELRTSSNAFEVTGPDCGSGCVGAISFAYGGATGNLFGGTFQVSNGNNVNQVFGSAMFQQVATGTTTSPSGTAGRVGGTSTGTGGTGGTGGSDVANPPRVATIGGILSGFSGTATVNVAAGSNRFANAVTNYDPQGAPINVVPGVTDRGTLNAQQSASGTGWLIGRYGGIGTAGNGASFAALQGLHFVNLVPATSLPTGGRAEYQIIASTTPTYNQAGNGIGLATNAGSQLSGRLAVAFGTTNRFGMDATLTVVTGATNTYAIGSAASFTTPDLGLTVSGGQLITSSSFGVTVPVGAACGACNFTLYGVLGGADLRYFGGTYQFGQAPGTSSQTNLSGAFMAQRTSLTGTTIPDPLGTGTGALIYRSQIAGFDRADVVTDAAGLVSASGIGPTGNTVITRENRGTATDAEFGTSGPVSWSRWTSGTTTRTTASGTSTQATYGAFDGQTQIWGTRATALPTSGTAVYTRVGATAVAVTNGTALGTLDTASLGVAFGATTRVGVSIGATIGGTSYSMTSTGGVAAPGMVLNASTMTFGSDIGVVGGSCTVTTCFGGISGFLSGEAASHAALSFDMPTGTAANSPLGHGTIAFARGEIVQAPSSGGPAFGTGTQIVKSYGAFPGTTTDAVVTADSAGRVSSYATATIAVGRGTNTDREFGSVAGVIGWTRWAGGTTTASSNRPDLIKTIPENGGGSFVYGTAATALPTSGTASYDMIGNPAVVVNGGDSPLASVTSAALAVNFATLRAGFEATLNSSGQAYTLASTGGTGAPSMAIANNQFSLSAGSTIVGNGCTGSNCSARIEGFLAGPGASHAGVSFTFAGGVGAGAPSINGVVAFAKRP